MVQPWNILLAFFADLVNEDALGVDVLGPRLAVEGHLLLLRKLNFATLVCYLSPNLKGTCTFSSLNIAAALERSRIRLLGVFHLLTEASLISDLLMF